MSTGVDIDVVVAGGGAVGLAIAAALAASGREVMVIEAGERCGDETSGRNNQVVHAGFLYPPASLKARLCRDGHRRLMDFARQRGIPHRSAPKLMPAADPAGRAMLEQFLEQGRAVGVTGLEILDKCALAALEPQMRAEAALLSPGTGIIDAAALVAALEGEVQSAGGLLVLRSRITGGAPVDRGTTLSIADEEGAESALTCALFINSAGLGAAGIAAAMSGFPNTARPAIHLARGQFLSHRGAVPFSHLVVPVEPALSAGGSLTHDTGGQARFGPDLSFLPGRDYAPDAAVSDRAVDAIRSWWADLDPGRLDVDYVGIRPRVTGPGLPPGDWLIAGPERHGLPGQYHLFGIDTPGLTACLSLAEHIVALSGKSGNPEGKVLP
ncbi:NAD(P)/FAD-dependent oxidoreductase [Oceanibium sediminis]|uniref:NAD(P)/FAD-dependent oxidoreductase n=1 Tax=Oceanibium sediminis TaxID=2026339 RepID=UPI0013004107|nr:FAD-dependent oxidoreductase [Oceanibium sediminis]